MKNPLGIDLQNPVLSWVMDSEQRGCVQEAYRVIVCEAPEELKKEQPVAFYDSGKVESDAVSLALPRMFVKSGTRYYWSVQVWDNHGQTAVSEETAWLETGLLYEKDWQAKWIEPLQSPVLVDRAWGFPWLEYQDPEDVPPAPISNDEALEMMAKAQHNDETVLFPCQMIRKEFKVKGKVKEARIYATAHGVYRLEMNGKRVGDYELAPECTPYNTFLQVQTYDVTKLLNEGRNAIGAILGDGWWAGRIGNNGDSVQYGNKLALLMQMNIRYEDGSEEIIGTDGTFRSSQGPLRYSDGYMGEKYDAHINRDGWAEIKYKNTRLWQPTEEKEYGYANLTGQNADHMKVVRTIEDINIYTSAKGELMIDCGELIPGNLTMHISGEPHASVTFYYTQETDKDGNYWLEVMGANSRHEDVFVLDETGEGDYDPVFSQVGFRYVKVEANYGRVSVSNVLAREIRTPLEETLRMETSDSRLNQLNDNIRRTLLANAPSIPTDDADRERAGFTGDGQMSAQVWLYQFDARTFFSRWLKEMAHDQYPDGMVGFITPNWPSYQDMITMIYKTTSAGWGDASILVPWFAYKQYGEKKLLEQCYPMMKKYVAYVSERAASANPEDIGEITPKRAANLQYIWNADFNFGDWLTPSACYDPKTDTYTYYTQTLTYLLGTYFYAYDTMIMAEVADLLGQKEEAAYYRTLNERIRKAAVEEIYNRGGILESEYMGAQVMALHMHLCPEEDRQKVFDRLVELILERGMDTGFISTIVVEDILCEFGRSDLAYEFLLNDKFPSWLYEVEQGATTVWETMQAIRPDGSRQAVSYALTTFCSIGKWMVEGLCGIKALEPGFKKISIRPYISERISFAEGQYASVRGNIRCRWERDGISTKLSVTVPANTSAEVFLPGAKTAAVTESGHALTEDENIRIISAAEDGVWVCVNSGAYEFKF